MAASKKGQPMTTGCSTQVVGVRVYYCDGSEIENVWVDLKKVQAIAWCSGEIKKRNANPNGNSKLPKGQAPKVNACEKKILDEETPLCWWTGSEWVCGDE